MCMMKQAVYLIEQKQAGFLYIKTCLPQDKPASKDIRAAAKRMIPGYLDSAWRYMRDRKKKACNQLIYRLCFCGDPDWIQILHSFASFCTYITENKLIIYLE